MIGLDSYSRQVFVLMNVFVALKGTHFLFLFPFYQLWHNIFQPNIFNTIYYNLNYYRVSKIIFNDIVLYNSAKINPRQPILAVPLGQVWGIYWVKDKGKYTIFSVFCSYSLQLPWQNDSNACPQYMFLCGKITKILLKWSQYDYQPFLWLPTCSVTTNLFWSQVSLGLSQHLIPYHELFHSCWSQQRGIINCM